MAKRKNMMRKNLRRTVRTSLGRFVAIVAIIALGAGLFVGLLATKSDMVDTCQRFTDKLNMFDLRLVCTYGWTQEDVYDIAQMDGVVDAEGAIRLDALLHRDYEEDSSAYHLMSIPEDVNKVELLGGRMPQSPDECLADGYHADKSVIGTQYTVADDNDQDTLDSLACRTYTVVGYVSTPLYMNMERGNTSIGNGQVASYLYLMPEGFSVDYYTDIYVTIPGDYTIYTDEYDDAMDAAADALEPQLQPLADDRLQQVKAEAEAEYADGLAEYEDGLAEYEKGKKDAQTELADAKKQLEDGQKEIDENRATITEGKTQLEEGEKLLEDGEATLMESRQTLADAKNETYTQLAESNALLMENYKNVNSGLRQVNSALVQINSGITQLESGLSQIESGLEQLDMMIGILDAAVEAAQLTLNIANSQPNPDTEQIAELEQSLAELVEKRDGYVQQRDEVLASQEEYTAQYESLVAQKAELEATQTTLNDAMAEIELGFKELENGQFQAEYQFAAAEAQLDAAQQQLDYNRETLEKNRLELEAGELALEEAQAELDAGWAEYEKGKAEAEAELADAKAQLDDAKRQLDDARYTIDTLADAQVYALTRNTNVGYVSFESDSDIVAGVSRVFPAFFLLVAALVCITTMTRMVDEERTQIGTFKALGYSNGAIMGKYLAYSGIGAVTGCGLGVLIGSVVFPEILWIAYGILYNISGGIRLHLDVPLCLAVVLVYTAVTLFVTWYCCRRELREVPAELIRPRAPASGKKIFLEYLKFWDRISFLNKVAIRNIFRYRQRFIMMLLGIGGCTALLVTGFGLRDSVVDIVDIQFEEVMIYDISVSFGEDQQEQAQEDFREQLRDQVDQVLFCHQSSVELDTGDGVKDVYLLASDSRLLNFMDFHDGDKSLDMPGRGDALVSVGAAEAMGISVGDTVTLRNSDMDTMRVTITGIFDNNVYNHVIIDTSTLNMAWGDAYGQQTALLNVREGEDVHQVTAEIINMDDVLNVSVSEDLAGQVGSMMGALDLVIVTIVICAGLLAAIVLYNLTNINITERVREIATIKVLGFHAGESAAYVFKENLSLSVMGTLAGLLAGRFLLSFVLSQIKLDMVYFQTRVTFWSYLLSFVMTMLTACLVDFIFYFRLEKINMAEALKSVE